MTASADSNGHESSSSGVQELYKVEDSVKIVELINKWAADALTSEQEDVAKTCFVSLEFFPPRTAQGVQNLRDRLQRMKALNPLFVDFTWGAGGSTADLTLDLTIEAKQKYGMEANMHLTCTNMPVQKIDEALEKARAHGVRNIVALRGDPPAGTDHWEATDGGFRCALDLVRYIRKQHLDYFGISVAGYPEGHPDAITEVPGGEAALSPSERTRYSVHKDPKTGEDKVYVCRDEAFERELEYLKEKVDAGADFIITQMFFDVSVYARFQEHCRRVGINVPIVPGLMCLNAYNGYRRMVGFCKTRVPQRLQERMDQIKDDEPAQKEFGIEYGADMCRELAEAGAPGYHFYTLNLEKVTVGIVNRLGLQIAQQLPVQTQPEDTAQMINMIKSSRSPRGENLATPSAPHKLPVGTPDVPALEPEGLVLA